VERKVYPEVPPRVEYTLTRLGRTLREVVRRLINWSGAHLEAVDAARARYDARQVGQRSSVASETSRPKRESR
jgi:DNA-binding HxlR family transcriptional regulator